MIFSKPNLGTMMDEERGMILVFSRCTGGPPCSILHHWKKAWVHVADLSAGCHGSQWRDRDVPITKDVL